MMEFSHSKCAWLNVLIITNLIKVEEMIIIKFSSLKPGRLRCACSRTAAAARAEAAERGPPRAAAPVG